MKYDFKSIIDRRGKDALAIDGVGNPNMAKAPKKPKKGYSLIPMWVADMNFKTAPSLIEALNKRVNHPLFGYYDPSKDYINSIINWQKTRLHSKDIKAEYIGYEHGVLGGVINALRALGKKNEKVLLHSPTYIGFTECLTLDGFKMIHSPLIKDKTGKWIMDYQDMDNRIKKENIKFVILCNPHNPTGRVFSKDELLKAYKIFKKYNCIVLVDEIWSDLILDSKLNHIVSYNLNEDAKNRTIAFYSISKTFNCSGLVGAIHVIPNKELREKIELCGARTRYNNMNVLSMHASIGAYTKEGSDWTDELLKVLKTNNDYAYDFIKKNFKGVNLYKPEGTYMMYIDCKDYCLKHKVDIDTLLKKAWDVGVAYQDGRPFNYPYTIRLNLASPTSLIKEAFNRLKKYVFNY